MTDSTYHRWLSYSAADTAGSKLSSRIFDLENRRLTQIETPNFIMLAFEFIFGKAGAFLQQILEQAILCHKIKIRFLGRIGFHILHGSPSSHRKTRMMIILLKLFLDSGLESKCVWHNPLASTLQICRKGNQQIFV
ncbi:hypothetical protein KP509_38G014400 [Ceratopteris richardii]|uniref:Uncharacterized protein n=1 Tax=Ceratopteris richardii TaxID=49495 RepID=A0A8T2Q2L6_CERRI|nr:hypothetical protein KP509_38G014400 [Ceratopteris richardii]